MTILPSLQAIASALGGRVVRNPKPHVAAPYPGMKKHDRSLHVFINGDDIGIKVFRDGVDPIELKDYVRSTCGLPAWQPKQRKPKPKRAVSLAIRNHFFGETLNVCRLRRRIAPAHFALLMNDLRLRGHTRDAIKYAREFGFGPADIERCVCGTPRHYTADERAKILNLTYAERQHLGLRRTGSIDLDKVGRERARRDRYNAKRRAARAGARVGGVNKRYQVEGRPEVEMEDGEIASKVAVPMTNGHDQLLKSKTVGDLTALNRPFPAIRHEQLAEMWLFEAAPRCAVCRWNRVPHALSQTVRDSISYRDCSRALQASLSPSVHCFSQTFRSAVFILSTSAGSFRSSRVSEYAVHQRIQRLLRAVVADPSNEGSIIRALVTLLFREQLFCRYEPQQPAVLDGGRRCSVPVFLCPRAAGRST
jgi:hypothetical protein